MISDFHKGFDASPVHLFSLVVCLLVELDKDKLNRFTQSLVELCRKCSPCCKYNAI